MEALLGLFGLGLVLLLLAAPVIAIIALARITRLGADLRTAQAAIGDLEVRLEALAKRVVRAVPEPVPAPTPPPTPTPAPEPARVEPRVCGAGNRSRRCPRPRVE